VRSAVRRSLPAVVFLLLAGCASEPRRPEPPLEAGTPRADAANAVLFRAIALVGTPYRYGGNTPDSGFDCSGLVRYVMAALKVELPRTAAQQARIGDEVSTDPSSLRPGDLLTFGRKGRSGVSHIGIYVGQGRYIHASSVAGRVIESDLNRTGSPLIKAWRGVRRVVAGAEPDTSKALSGG